MDEGVLKYHQTSRANCGATDEKETVKMFRHISEGCRRVLPDDDQSKSEAHEGCADTHFYWALSGTYMDTPW
jgi:hypothetical protein